MNRFAPWAHRAMEQMRHLVTTFGPRLAGSTAGQRAVKELMESTLQNARKTLGAQAESAVTSRLSSFAVHPAAFLGFIRVMIALYVLALPLGPFVPLASFALLTLALFILVAGFVFYLPVIDWAFPRKQGTNGEVSLEPTGAVTKEVIVSGHHDSAPVFTYLVKGLAEYNRRVTSGIGMIIAGWGAAFVLWLVGPGLVASSLWLIATLLGLSLVLPLWNFAAREGTPGAGDNLIASTTAAEILGYFAGQRLKNTRVTFVSFDAEEAGLRGARAWARANRHRLEGHETYHFNIECLYNVDALFFLSSDLNGSVKLDADFTSTCAAVMGEVLGRPIPVKPIDLLAGGTDAAELAKIGVKATCVMGMNWSGGNRAAVYHTPNDTPDAVDQRAVEAVVATAIQVIKQLDRTE